MPIRVRMPNGTVRPFREGTSTSVIRRAQADMIADMKASGHYDGCDFSEFESRPKKVTVTQWVPGKGVISGPATAQDLKPGFQILGPATPQNSPREGLMPLGPATPPYAGRANEPPPVPYVRPTPQGRPLPGSEEPAEDTSSFSVPEPEVDQELIELEKAARSNPYNLNDDELQRMKNDAMVKAAIDLGIKEVGEAVITRGAGKAIRILKKPLEAWERWKLAHAPEEIPSELAERARGRYLQDLDRRLKLIEEDIQLEKDVRDGKSYPIGDQLYGDDWERQGGWSPPN